MGNLRYTGIETVIHGMSIFNIFKKSEVETNNFCSQSHMYWFWDKGSIAC